MKINTHILNLYLDKQLSEDEVRKVELELEENIELQAEFKLLQKVYTSALAYTEISDSAIDSEWIQLMSKIDAPIAKNKNVYSWIKYASAAAVLIFSGLFLYQSFFNGKVDKIALNNELFILPDGSELIMNAGSEISFNEKTYLEKRSVAMIGDILFRVESNKKNPFFLLTANSKIEVTGTKFRVFTNKVNTSVTLFKGELLIKNETNTLHLKQGENATCVEGELYKNTSSLKDNSVEWFSLDFESIQFSEIIKNLERRFDVSIKYPQNIKNQKYTIKAEGLQLEEIITILTELTNTSVTTNGRFIELKS